MRRSSLQGIDDENLDGGEAHGVLGDEVKTVAEGDSGDGNPRKSTELKVGHYEGLLPVLSFQLRLGVLRYKVIEAISILAAFTD